MKLISAAAVLAVLTLAAAPVHAAPPASAPARAAQTAQAQPQGFLAREALPDVAALLSRPPEPGDEAWVDEGRSFKALRALKDTPRWRRAQYDDAYAPDIVLAGFACAIGADLSKARTPRTAELVERASWDMVQAADGVKDRFKRQRPFVATDEPICIERTERLEKSYSYPSTHAGTGWIYGLLLAGLAPDRAAQIMAHGRAFGDSRLICGVHWKSDVAAGREAATATYVVEQTNAEFLKIAAAARAEVAAARKAGSKAENCEAERALDMTPLH